MATSINERFAYAERVTGHRFSLPVQLQATCINCNASVKHGQLGESLSVSMCTGAPDLMVERLFNEIWRLEQRIKALEPG